MPENAGVPLVAGVDCSTQSTKVVVVDVDDGTVVAAGRATHEVTGTESHPSTWHEALTSALAETGRAAEVAAIAVGGQQHGLVVCDAAGEPLRSAILWNDTRSAAEAEALVSDFGATWWAANVGSVPVPAFTVTSWAWLRGVESTVADATRSIRLPHDWLTEQLCGRGVTDRGDASGTGWWSTPQGRYVDEVLDHPAVSIDRDLLPEVLGPTDAAGEVVLGRFGLPSGALVACGTGDNMAAALGLGLAPGEPVISLGTSGTAYVVSTTPANDPSGVVAGFADATGLFLPLACTLNATLAVDRVAGWLGLGRDEAAPSSGSVVIAPYLDGERTPNLPDATGLVVGLTHDTTPAEILRAAYEGVVVSLLDALARIVPDDGSTPIVLIGGGARGATWRDVVRRLSGRPVIVPDADELVALGAAAQAAALVTGEAPDAVARRWGTGRGTVLDALPRDLATLERSHRVREAAAELF
jgi:xylulokinase